MLNNSQNTADCDQHEFKIFLDLNEINKGL